MDLFIINNTENEILKLKEELMYSNDQSYTDTKSISDTIKQILNEDIGHTYEENLRQIFYENLQYFKADLPRKITYLIITIENKYQILITKECGKQFDFKNYTWEFTMNDFQVVMSFRSEKEKGKTLTIAHNNTSRVKYYVQTKVEIGNVMEKEMDGLFSITKFDLNVFNSNEIEILYNNFGNYQDFNYLVMEAKYNFSKLAEMIDQLEKDHFIISNIKTKRVCYLGIVNGKIPTHNFRNLKLDFDCIIISIKKYNFFDRDVRKFYDWGLIQRVIETKKEIGDIKNEIVDVKNEISALKSGFQEF